MDKLPILVIPAYQPDARLVPFVEALGAKPFPRILVVDDGSRPACAPIFSELAKLPRVTVLRHARNLGKGAALKTAINHVLVEYPEAVGIVTGDADGQHRVEDVVRVAETLVLSPHSLVLGVRRFGDEVPLRSRFGNELTKIVFRFLLGRRLEDTQTGLRGIPKKLMYELLGFASGRYEFELDMLVYAVQRRFPVSEVPIQTIYEDGNKAPTSNPIWDSLRIYFVFVRFIFASLATFATDFTFFTLSYWGAHNLLASVLAGRMAGLLVSLLGSKFFVFHSPRAMGEVLPRFLALWAALLAISYGLTYGLIERMGMNAYLARVLVDSFLFLFNFSVQRNLIFTNEPEPETAEAEARG